MGASQTLTMPNPSTVLTLSLMGASQTLTMPNPSTVLTLSLMGASQTLTMPQADVRWGDDEGSTEALDTYTIDGPIPVDYESYSEAWPYPYP